MALILGLAVVALVMSWEPLQRAVPFASSLAFVLTGVVVVVFFQLGLLD